MPTTRTDGARARGRGRTRAQSDRLRYHGHAGAGRQREPAMEETEEMSEPSAGERLTTTTGADGDVVRIEGEVRWEIRPAEGGYYVGECDALDLVLQSNTWAEMMESIVETMDALFGDLCAENELEDFLRERGWVAHGNAFAGAKFDIPVFLLPAEGGRADSAIPVH